MSKLTKKVSTTVVSIATVVSLSGAGALLPMAVYGATVEELTAQINSLLATIAALQAQLAAMTGAPAAGTVPAALLSSGDLTLGSKGAAVKALQQFLNANGAQLAASGAGSPGSETEYFGSLTKAALAKWQAANGVAPAAGYFGPITRAKLSTLGAAAAPAAEAPAAEAPAVVPAGTGLTVTLASVQPTATLAPGDASRVPFTKLALTASSDGDVTVNYLTVKRVGLAADASLDSVILLDDQGNQLGLKKTLTSEHTANIGEAFTVKAGQTKYVTLAANRAAVGGSYAGQSLALQLVSVNTSAAVHGALPLTGTTHTVNETLTIGSVTVARGPVDPGASQTKEIGTTGYVFSSVKVTAGSAEKMFLKSIRWNQTGSAGSGDLENIKTYVDGVAYGTTVSSDGKYYTTTLPDSGLLIDKGFNKEIYIKGDIIGGSARTITMDVAKRTDLYLVGETYGYGTIPPQTGTAAADDTSPNFTNSEDPWYNGGKVTVSSGTMTVSTWNAVAAQNIARNLADQPLGGWTVDVKGEPISVASMKFSFLLTEDSSGTTGLGTDNLDNVKLVDETGKVLAGPLDVGGTTLTGTDQITFTDTITFPVGITNLKMVGKLEAGTTAFENNDTVQASTTPSSKFGTVTGTVTGVTITPSPTSAVSGQTMTVKAGALTISVGSVPIDQTIIAGINQFEFARYVLDTASSGEDLRLTSLPLEYNVPSGSATDLTNCKLYDGSTVLMSGSNIVNPTARGSSTVFTFDGTGLTLAKGTAKTLSLKCDLKSAATGSYRWGYDSASSPSPTGLTSGQSVTPTENDSMGQLMTAASAGTLTASLDVTASYKIVAPGETTELARIKFSASKEDISLSQVTLILSSAASNTREDLVGQKVTLWDGATQLGEAVFASGDHATSSAITGFVVPKDGSKVMTVKGTIAGVSFSGPLTRSGDKLVVNYDGGGGLTSNYGTGVSSGQTITPTSAATDSTGVRIMKAYPEFAQDALTTSEKVMPTSASDNVLLYKWKVTAKNGDISIAKFTFSVSSTTAASSNATTSKFSVYAYTNSTYSSADQTLNSTGLINVGQCYNGHENSVSYTNSAAGDTGGQLGGNSALVQIYPQTGCHTGTTSLKIPSGESRWFKLKASIGTPAPSNTADSLRVQLEGDAAFPVNSDVWMQKAGTSTLSVTGWRGGVNSDTNNDFIWSPRSTSTNENDTNYLENLDWTNGYGVSGLTDPNMDTETVSK